MRTAATGLFAFAWILASVWCAPPAAAAGKRQWQTGHVVAQTLEGQGPGKTGPGNRLSRGDVWWSYCVAAPGRSYLVVSRESPAKTGMPVNGTIRFYLDKKRMHVLNSRGERLSLRIQREEPQSTCR